MISVLQSLRRELHQHPELSGWEVETATRIHAFIQEHYPTKVIENIGGSGLAAVYDFGGNGPTVMIRCELDALPIAEPNDFDYRSEVEGVSHKCGHDGHMAMVAGAVLWLKEQSFGAGRVVFFFQAAEETGKGAALALADERFRALKPDYVFALHNIPGAPLGEVVVTPEMFSPTVQSFAVHLAGKEAHASEPENGHNPALAISEMVGAFADLNVPDAYRPDFAVLTPVHLRLGQKAYGISPGRGELHYTIRTWTEAEMTTLKARIESQVTKVCQRHHLEANTDWFEYFPGTVNDAECRERVMEAASKNGFKLKEQAVPFRFGEDFGWLAREYKVAMFGLGAGENCPALHHAEYDFPEEVLPVGIGMFAGLIEGVLGVK